MCPIATKKALGLTAEGCSINVDFTRTPVGSSARYAVQAALGGLGWENQLSL